jgi:hypothetical protein
MRFFDHYDDVFHSLIYKDLLPVRRNHSKDLKDITDYPYDNNNIIKQIILLSVYTQSKNIFYFMKIIFSRPKLTLLDYCSLICIVFIVFKFN